MKQGISGIMLVKNEENNIYYAVRCLQRVCNEVIVVDTGSNDDTISIAENMGCRVYVYDWDEHFGRARNFSISKARYNWVFYLDADEQTTTGFQENLHDLIKTKDTVLFRFSIVDQLVPHAGGGKPVRLFPAKCRFSERGNKMLHTGNPVYNDKQEPLGEYQIKNTPFIIKHYQKHNSIIFKPEKILRRVALDVESKNRNGPFIKYLGIGCISFIGEFYKRLIIKHGYLDGTRGLKWILLRCSYYFLLYFFIGLKPWRKKCS